MFTVEMKDNPDVYVNVYTVTEDSNGYPKFLVFIDNQWKYMSAKHFAPVGTFVKNNNLY